MFGSETYVSVIMAYDKKTKITFIFVWMQEAREVYLFSLFLANDIMNVGLVPKFVSICKHSTLRVQKIVMVKAISQFKI